MAEVPPSSSGKQMLDPVMCVAIPADCDRSKNYFWFLLIWIEERVNYFGDK
jgi:hypothetical protein